MKYDAGEILRNHIKTRESDLHEQLNHANADDVRTVLALETAIALCHEIIYIEGVWCAITGTWQLRRIPDAEDRIMRIYRKRCARKQDEGVKVPERDDSAALLDVVRLLSAPEGLRLSDLEVK